MKRMISILLIATMMLSFASLAGTGAVADTTVASSSYATVTSTNGYGVRMREGPSTSYNVITKYPVNTTVTVLQKGSDWSQITVGGLTGWMMNQYLVFGATGSGSGSSSSSSGSTSSGVSATVTSGNGLRVWLRATAGGKRLALYKPGTQVTVLEKGSKWCRISIGGSIGYMMTEFLNFGSSVTPTPVYRTVEGVSLNYDYPAAGDVLEPTVVPAEATVTYTWKVNGVVQSTASTFKVLGQFAGKVITLDVKGTGAYTGSAHTQTEEVQNDPYVKGVTLSKTSPVVGDVLSAQVQPSSATVDYAWRVGGTLMSSDTTYTVQPDDIGKPIQLKVTGTGNYMGSAVATASASVISQYELQSVSLNKDTPVVGDVLSVTIEPSSASASVAWYVGGVKAAETASYKVESYDLGKKIEARVSGVDPYTGTVSASTNRVVSANLTSVSISGSTKTGNCLYASVSPANADATYEWYVDGKETPIGFFSSMVLTDDLLGKQVYVVANGAGSWGGQVGSSKSSVITSGAEITAVTLNITSPVVGDTITATVSPSGASASYIWSIGTETCSTSANTYTVKAEDAGKQIRVLVSATGKYPGEVYSGWTSAVKSSTEVKSVYIYNRSRGEKAGTVEATNVLEAKLDPSQAEGKVDYQWQVYDGKAWANAGSDKTFKVPATASKVRVWAIQKSGTGYYIKNVVDKVHKIVSGESSVSGNRALNGKLTMTPIKAGQTPVSLNTKLSGTYVYTDSKGVTSNKSYSGTLVGYTSSRDTAFDEYNHYWGDTLYYVYVSLSDVNGYSLSVDGASVTLNGVPFNKYDSGRKAYRFGPFNTAADYQVSDFNITGIPAPVVGEKACTSLDNSSQYKLDIEWDRTDTNGYLTAAEKHIATITATAKGGFTMDGVPANAFRVSGADHVTSSAGSANQVVIIAEYNTPSSLLLMADNNQVEMDGQNRRIVNLSARLSNGVDITGDVQWTVSGMDADGTYIEDVTAKDKHHTNVKLIISANETVDKSLTVTAKLGAYESTLSIALVSGENYNGDLQVIISQVSRSTDSHGNLLVKLSAMVRNSVRGVNWLEPSAGEYASTDDYNATVVIPKADLEAFQKEMALYPDVNSKYVLVRAESQEDKSVEQGKYLIEIPKIEGWTPTGPSSLEPTLMLAPVEGIMVETGEPEQSEAPAEEPVEEPAQQPVEQPAEEPAQQPEEEEVSTDLFETEESEAPAQQPAQETQPETSEADQSETQPVVDAPEAEVPSVVITVTETEPEQPVEEEPAPEAEPEQPVEEELAPEAEPEQPAEEESAPETEPEQPVEEEPAPEAEPEQPVEEEPAPEAEPEQPVEEEPAPEAEPEQPVEEEPAPEAEPEQPAEEEKPAEPEVLEGPVIAVYTDVTKTEVAEQPEPEAEPEQPAETEKKSKKDSKKASEDPKAEEPEEVAEPDEEVADDKATHKVRLSRSRNAAGVYTFRLSQVKDMGEIASISWRVKKGADAKVLSETATEATFKVHAEKTFTVEYTVVFTDGFQLVRSRTVKLGEDAQKKQTTEPAAETPATEKPAETPAEKPAEAPAQLEADAEKEMAEAALREENNDAGEDVPAASEGYQQMQQDLSGF